MSRVERSRRTVVIALGVVALIIVSVLAIAMRREPIEDDLTHRAESALASAGIGGLSVEFEGRDATLSGEVASEAERLTALQIVTDLEGVRTVDGLLVVAAAPTTLTIETAADTATGKGLAADRRSEFKPEGAG